MCPVRESYAPCVNYVPVRESCAPCVNQVPRVEYRVLRSGEVERFNSLYVVKLERELTSAAQRLAALESTVRAVADRALAWDNIQASV